MKKPIQILADKGWEGDLTDFGNEVGQIIAKYINSENPGMELDDFISGVKHGVSLKDGTHP